MSKKDLTRREFLRMAAMATVATGLAACKATPTATPVPTKAPVVVEPTKAPQELTKVTCWESGNPPFANKCTELAASIESETGLSMEFLPSAGGWNPQLDRVSAAMAAGTPPDLIHVKDFHMWDFASRDALYSLDEFYARGDLDIDGFRGPIRQSMSYKGVKYGVPHRGSFVWVQFVNDDMYTDAGLDPTTDVPATWQEIIDTGTKLKGGDPDKFGHAFYELAASEPSIMCFSTYVGQAGGRLILEDGTLTFDTPEALEALQWMCDAMYESKVVLPAESMSNVWDLVYNGFVGSWSVGPWFIGMAASNAPQLNWSLHQLPCHKTCDNVDTPECVMIAKGVPDLETSWKMAAAITIPELDEVLSTVVGSLPIYAENLSKGKWASDPAFVRFGEIGQDPELRARWWVEGYNELVPVVGAEIEPAWYGQLDPKEALTNAQKAGEAVLERVKKERG